MEKQNGTAKEVAQDFALENVIVTAAQIPGVKVNRDKFLAEVFPRERYPLSDILESDPVQMQIPQEELKRVANRLIVRRTSQSSIASFVTGLPGGLAMAATIPADILQFFGMALRLAQELAYLYGAKDLWINGSIDDERVKNQLILYCGAMFGVASAVSGVRVLTTQIAKTVARKLPQQALTKTFWYPIVKQIGKAIGVKVTKQTVAKGATKVVPVLGGIISGGLNFVSMMPMANRLLNALDESCFNYTEAEMEADIEIIDGIDENEVIDLDDVQGEQKDAKVRFSQGVQNVKSGFAELMSRKPACAKKTVEPAETTDDVLATIEQLAKLKEMGAITQEEFDTKKSELLAKL